jgi:hypothetical protein
MAPLFVRCPKTRALLLTPVDTTFRGLAEDWNKTFRVPCPHCGDEHPIKVREAFIQSEISGLEPRAIPISKGG